MIALVHRRDILVSLVQIVPHEKSGMQSRTG